MISRKWTFIASVVFGGYFLVSAAAWGAPRLIVIKATESKFEPNKITVKAGETITIKLLNQSTQKKEHELMIGRKVRMGGPFKDRPSGFHTDFFDGLHVKYMGGEKVKMIMAGEAKLTKMKPMKMAKMKMDGMKMSDKKMKMGGMKMSGMKMSDKKMKMGGMKMKKDDHGEKKMGGMKMKMKGPEADHPGFMITLLPKGNATITFTVPKSKVGTWEMGCFTEDGVHYKEGMRGTFIVTN